MHCSLLKIDGNLPRKLITDDYTDYGDQAGLKFIKLQHKFGFSMNEPAAIRGFQGADIIVTQERSGRLNYEATLSKDKRSGEACAALRGLIFEPEQRTNMLTAVVPDTPFNRRKLACVYYHGPFADIMDPEIDREIDQLAREIELTLPKEKTKDDTIKDQGDEISILRRQASEAQAKIDDLKIKAGIAEDAKDARLSNTPSEDPTLKVPLPDSAVKQEETPDEIKSPSETAIPLPDGPTNPPAAPNPGSFANTTTDLREIRKQITEQVHEEFAPLIKSVKKDLKKRDKDPKYFTKSKLYREQVLPVINERYKERRDADNAGAGIDN